MDLLGIGTLASKVLDKVIPDASARAAAQLELAKLKQSGELAELGYQAQQMQAQSDINKVEAASTNLFVSGWRPFVGWICASGLGIQFIVAPLLEWASTLAGHATKVPTLDMGTMMTLLAGMLGMGGMRTVERLNGKANGQ